MGDAWVAVEELRVLAERVHASCGVPPAHARLQADLLLAAELRGQPSHGLQRLPLLVTRLESGLADGVTAGTHAWTRPGYLSVDGRQGLGPVVMLAAMDDLEASARRLGVAIAGIRHANHLGMLAYYAEEAVRRGMIGLVMSTSEALVHPFGGTEPLLGTNPMALGIPTGAAPFIFDFATSTVSMGKIRNHALQGSDIPSDWAVDAAGRPTTDPTEAVAIAPFGGPKGYGLGLGIELLVAALAGTCFAPDTRGTIDAKHPASKGDLLILIDPDARDGAAPGLSGYLDRLRGSRPSDPDRPVAVPGDGARQRSDAARSAIALPAGLQAELRALVAD